MAVVLGAVLLGVAGLTVALTGVAVATPPAAPTSAGCCLPRPSDRRGHRAGIGSPDVLSAVFGFSTTASSSAAALGQNEPVALALQALTANGVASRDTQTTGLNLSAQYAYPHGVPTLTGYQATETITATLRKASTEGTAIDDVVNATGNAAQVNSLTFSFGNPAVVQDKARMAESPGRGPRGGHGRCGRPQAGPVCSLTDNTQPTVPPYGQDLNDESVRRRARPCRSTPAPRSNRTR